MTDSKNKPLQDLFQAWHNVATDKDSEQNYNGIQLYPVIKDLPPQGTPFAENAIYAFSRYPGEDDDNQILNDVDISDPNLGLTDLAPNYARALQTENDNTEKLNQVFKDKYKIASELNKLVTDRFNDEINKHYEYDKDNDEFVQKSDLMEDIYKRLGEDALKNVIKSDADIQNRLKQFSEIDKNILIKRKDYRDLNAAVKTLDDAIKEYNELRADPSKLRKDGELNRNNLSHNARGVALTNALRLAGIDMTEDDFIDKSTPKTLIIARDRLAHKLNQLHNFRSARIDLQDDLTNDIQRKFMIKAKNVKMDTQKDLEDIAKPTLDAYTKLIKDYKQYLTPDVITKLKDDVDQLSDYMKNVGRIAADKSAKKTYLDMLKKIKHNVETNYKQIMDKLNIYSNSVSAEDALINEIKSLASYEQYTQLPPAIFEQLPEDIKKKCLYLMELKSKLQRQQGKTKNISQKYKINASNKPVSEDKESKKVLNPMLNRGYSIFNKVAQHNAYNAGFL